MSPPWARLGLIVAAGSGIRLARPEPKALVPLRGRPILSWALDTVAAAHFTRAVVVAPPDRLEAVSQVVAARAQVVAGGDTRAASVRRGFRALAPADEDIVAIHDAARPLVTVEEFEAVLRAAEESGAAIAATPVVDTIKRVSGGRVVGTVEREGLFGAATPQAFRGAVLRQAIASGLEATDEAALCERIGIAVSVVVVSPLSFKITTRGDLEIAEAILATREGPKGG